MMAFISSTPPTPLTFPVVLKKVLTYLVLFILGLLALAALVIVAFGLGLFILVFLSICIKHLGLDETGTFIKHWLMLLGGLR